MFFYSIPYRFTEHNSVRLTVVWGAHLKITQLKLAPTGQSFAHIRALLHRHVPRICPRGVGRGLGGPRVTPSKTKNSSDLGLYFLGGAPFYKKKDFEKKVCSGPHPDSYKGPVTAIFKPHSLQRSPKTLFAHPWGSCVAPGAHGIQRSHIGT